MIVHFFPRIAGIKILTPWASGKRREVDCVARLTRNLTSSEAERLAEMLHVEVRGDRLHYRCRPEELDQEEERITQALLRVADQGRARRRGSRRPTAAGPQ